MGAILTERGPLCEQKIKLVIWVAGHMTQKTVLSSRDGGEQEV